MSLRGEVRSEAEHFDEAIPHVLVVSVRDCFEKILYFTPNFFLAMTDLTRYSLFDIVEIFPKGLGKPVDRPDR